MKEALTSMGTAQITVHRHYFGGCNREPAQNRFIDVINPSTGKVDSMVSFGCAEDVDRAVKTATIAGKDGWSKLSGADRHQLLIKMADLIQDNSRRLASYITADTGKPITVAEGECTEAERAWRFYGALSERVSAGEGGSFPDSFIIKREPKGVVGIILPAISPILDFSRYVAAAVACGNTVVIKPSEYSTRSILALADMTKSIGFPDGVINVVCGDGDGTGNCLARHPGVAHICFVGSTEVGKIVAAKAARELSGITCELSAKNPTVVFQDADIDKAVNSIMQLAFLDNGQSNFCSQKILVHESVKQKVTERLLSRVNKLKVGYPRKTATEVGPLLCPQNFDRVDCFIRMAVDEGARILVGGAKVSDERLSDGFYFQPTLLDKVTPDMQIAMEEICGPVITLLEFSDDDEALVMCNESRFGLAAWIFTQSLTRARSFSKMLHTSNVLVNSGPLPRATLPIAPCGDSGLGSNLGADAIANLTRVKHICFE